jgi:FkbM family methyltransferase
MSSNGYQDHTMVTNNSSRSGILSLTSQAVDAIGLRRSRWGRELIAAVNVAGQKISRLVYLRRGGPFLIDGHKIFLSGRNAPSWAFVNSVLHDQYEPETKALLCRLIQPGMTVFDIGAHVGHYTLLAARIVGPTGHVYAFEAEPENFAILKRNVELNGYKNVTCVPKAVSNRTGTLDFFVSHQGNDRHTLIGDPNSMSHVTKRSVPAVSIDDFVAEIGCPTADVIKMDVEGAEPFVLEGMTDMLRRSTGPQIVLEFAPEIIRAGGMLPDKFLGYLISLGLSISPVEKGFDAGAFEREHLPETIAEIERRGAVNLFCEKSAVPSGAELGQ